MNSLWRPAVRSFAKTDIGRHRKANEDSFFKDDNLRLFIVADGMGGHAAGEIASGEAVDTVYGMVKRGLGPLGDLYQPLDEERGRMACRLLESAIQAATCSNLGVVDVQRPRVAVQPRRGCWLAKAHWGATAVRLVASCTGITLQCQ